MGLETRRTDEDVREALDETALSGMYLPSLNKLRWPCSADAIESASPNDLNNLAWALIEEKLDVDGGIVLAEKALQKEPNEPNFLDTLALGYLLKGLYDRAVECLQAAVKSLPKDAELQEHLERAKKTRRDAQT